MPKDSNAEPISTTAHRTSSITIASDRKPAKRCSWSERPTARYFVFMHRPPHATPFD